MDLAGHACMTTMTILLSTNAIRHGGMIQAFVLLMKQTGICMATAVRKLKLIQMADRYVLATVVRVLRSSANLVADHVPPDLHVAGFFQMMCA